MEAVGRSGMAACAFIPLTHLVHLAHLVHLVPLAHLARGQVIAEDDSGDD